jgi:hypothetical protein
MPMSSDSQRILQESVSRMSEAAASLDDLYAMQAKLTLGILRNVVEAAVTDITPRSVSDLDFALNDVRELLPEIPEDAAETFENAVAACSAVVDALKREAAIPADVLTALGALREKLSVRRTAIDRATYRDPDEVAPPLPHEPSTLQGEATQLRDALQRAGFDTPALSFLIASPAECHRAELSEVVDELDVISGA